MSRDWPPPHARGRSRRACALLASPLALALAVGACSDGGRGTDEAPTCGFTDPGACRPDNELIDLDVPGFSRPTEITNPYFPSSALAQVVQLGQDAGAAARAEITLLPETRRIEWNGLEVDVVVVQFVGYLDGRIVEHALDYFAQADDGSVWYFGEDVDNFEDGVIADHDGTWLAGRDGPPGMIMPGEPAVGAVFRPENVPGLVFEEDAVLSVTDTAAGPSGPIDGVLRIEEHLMDGTFEEKLYAPGYGEFQASTEEELVTVAVAVPIDAAAEPEPPELGIIAASMPVLAEAAEAEDWSAASAALETMTAAWTTYGDADVPELLGTQMNDALDAATAALDANDAGATLQGALAVAEACLDLQLRYRPVTEVDVARLDVWARRATLAAESQDEAALSGDVAVLEIIWARAAHSVTPAVAEEISAALEVLREATDAGDVGAAAAGAALLLAAVSSARQG
jgi:DNA-binding ferritin-like protein (Dps family)